MGFVRLLECQLENAPAADKISVNVLAAVDALTSRGIGEDASDRVKTAFVNLSAHAKRWPTPAQIIESMPKRSEVRYKRLVHHSRPEVAQNEIQKMRAIRKGEQK